MLEQKKRNSDASEVWWVVWEEQLRCHGISRNLISQHDGATHNNAPTRPMQDGTGTCSRKQNRSDILVTNAQLHTQK